MRASEGRIRCGGRAVRATVRVRQAEERDPARQASAADDRARLPAAALPLEEWRAGPYRPERPSARRVAARACRSTRPRTSRSAAHRAAEPWPARQPREDDDRGSRSHDGDRGRCRHRQTRRSRDRRRNTRPRMRPRRPELPRAPSSGGYRRPESATFPRIEYSARAASHSSARLSRSALPMTDTELKVIAALAIIGLSSRPTIG